MFNEKWTNDLFIKNELLFMNFMNNRQVAFNNNNNNSDKIIAKNILSVTHTDNCVLMNAVKSVLCRLKWKKNDLKDIQCW